MPSFAAAAAAIGFAAAAGLSAAAAAAPPPFPLGAYIGNPDGYTPANEASFEARLASFTATMGAAPRTMDTFIDFGVPPSGWAGSAAWNAYSWARSPVVGQTIVPMIGMPMSDNWHWSGNTPGWTNDDFFKAIVAGTYDGVYDEMIDVWGDAGYRRLYIRLGYEMDCGCVPWFMGNDSATQADWVAAFRHLATLLRARAQADGITLRIVWNPVDINWTPLSVAAAWPGNAYVDVVATDSYSALYPTSLYDWALNNWTYDATIQQWWARPGNMQHFWTYPSANPWVQHGAGGWTFPDAVDLARTHHKPLGIAEAGAGGDGYSTGPVDDPQFPTWLADRLHMAQSWGVKVAFVEIWDCVVSNGNWAFSEPGDGKPNEAIVWARRFGAKP